MATYINYGEGEEDATVQGAEWLRGVVLHMQGSEAEETFTEKFKEYHNVESRRYDYGPVFDLFLDNSQGIFGYLSEGRIEDRLKEIESFFALVNSMLLMLEDENHLSRATTRLCDMFISETAHPDLRLRLLMMLYNTFNLPTLELRYLVFKYTIDYAAKVGLFDQILPYLDNLDAWMADWDKFMTVEDKRVLFRDIATYMRTLNKRLDAFAYLKRYHALLQGEGAKVLAEAEVVDMTVQLLKDAVQLPSVIQFDDILSFDSVKALRSAKKADFGPELVDLCGVFLSGTVNDLRTFHGKNKKLFEHHGLGIQDAMAKIRLLTLATLAHGRSEMMLSEVAKALDEETENIEPWVVRAISEGVIDGRIDQLNHKVLVKSAFQRKFGKEEWAFLDTKLTSWIDNLENVIKFIENQKTLAFKDGDAAAAAKAA